MRFRQIVTLVLVGYLAAVAAVGLSPTRVDSAFRSEVMSFADGLVASGFSYMSYSLVDALANVLWFAPVGVLVVLIIGRKHWILAFLLCAGLSCGIEVLQSILLPERVGSVSDVIANCSGAALGILAGVIVDQARALRRVAEQAPPADAGHQDIHTLAEALEAS